MPEYRPIEAMRETVREYRACGQFSATEVRELCPGPIDPRDLGCPQHIFMRVLESRAKNPRRSSSTRVTRRSTLPTALKVMTDDERRARAKAVAEEIHADEVREWASAPPTKYPFLDFDRAVSHGRK
jgi:hypothetical protein